MVTSQAQRWPNATAAIKEARIVGDNLAGIERKFGTIAGTGIAKVFDYMAAITGCNEAELQANDIEYRRVYLQQYDHAAYIPGAELMVFKLLFAGNGQILGLQGVGKAGIDLRIDVAARIIADKGNYNDLLSSEIAFAPPYSTAKDALNNLGSMAQGVIEGYLRYYDFDDLDLPKGNDEMMLVDIRAPEVFQKGHLPQAVNFPLATIRENLASLPRHKKIVLYCAYGYGAFIAYCILNQRGFDNAYMLEARPLTRYFVK